MLQPELAFELLVVELDLRPQPPQACNSPGLDVGGEVREPTKYY
jgi:hypothetical protein